MTRSQRYLRTMESLTIRNEKGQLTPLKLVPSQKIIWNFVAPRLDKAERLWFIVLKGRQIYATTFFEALTFLRTIERPNTNSLIIAQDYDSASGIFTMAKRFYENLKLPKMKPAKVREIIFPFPAGPSQFRVISAGKEAKGRGTTQTCVHCSEVAFWPHAEVLLGLMQAMPDLDDTLWVLESTANGTGGVGEMFYDQWKAAVTRKSKLVPIFIPWYVMKKYRSEPAIPEDEWDKEERILVKNFGKFGLDGCSLRWRRDTIGTKTQGSTELFHQEYPSSPSEAFISKGLPAFDHLAILEQQDNIREPKFTGTMEDDKFIELNNGELEIWKKPQSGHVYFIGVDSAEGLEGGDFSCAQIVDFTSMEQVAVIHGTITPWDFAKILVQVATWYNKAMVNIEVKSTGWAIQDYLIKNYMYPYLHPWKGKADRVKQGEHKLWGWDTNSYSRPLLIEAGRQAINTGTILIRDEATLEECKHFSRNDDGRYEAEAGHDDRVLALLLALRSGVENYSDIRPSFHNLNLSEPDNFGVRVYDAMDSDYLKLRTVHRTLRKSAKEAADNWMAL